MQNKQVDIAYIRKYVAGELSPKEMYELERAAHEDEMLMDIILGVEAEFAKSGTFPKADIQRRIADRITDRPVRNFVAWKLWGIAASILFAVGISFYLFQQRSTPQEEAMPITYKDLPKNDTLSTFSPAPVPRLLNERDSSADSRLAFAEKPKAISTPASKRTGRKTPRELRPASVPTDTHPLPDSSRREWLVAQVEPPKITEGVRLTAANKGKQASPNIRIRGTGTVAASSTTQTVVLGRVSDQTTKQPVYAQVKDLNTDQVFYTDSMGRFIAVSDSGKVALTISSIGYETQNLIAGTSEQDIRLAPANNSLDEVVVSGYRLPKQPKKAIPTTGWSAFRNYVKQAADTLGLNRGTVVLRFDIDEKGQPIQIRVESATSDLHADRATTILKNGPTWIPGRRSTNIKLTVEFDN
ncbi:carboxypeptidase-like regulatory domain-containing protein [Sphingobacterium suaedae]|uniref:Carboxypeptidase-like regulatory domain-containing protein n=1 Tax=Sphingobacterium suaedae TaxID=1686402 RepID=A0ABW5KMI0_9SPHI